MEDEGQRHVVLKMFDDITGASDVESFSQYNQPDLTQNFNLEQRTENTQDPVTGEV